MKETTPHDQSVNQEVERLLAEARARKTAPRSENSPPPQHKPHNSRLWRWPLAALLLIGFPLWEHHERPIYQAREAAGAAAAQAMAADAQRETETLDAAIAHLSAIHDPLQGGGCIGAGKDDKSIHIATPSDIEKQIKDVQQGIVIAIENGGFLVLDRSSSDDNDSITVEQLRADLVTLQHCAASLAHPTRPVHSSGPVDPGPHRRATGAPGCPSLSEGSINQMSDGWIFCYLHGDQNCLSEAETARCFQ